MLDATRSIRRSVETIDSHIALMRKRARSSRAEVVSFDLCKWVAEKIETCRPLTLSKNIRVLTNGCDRECRVVFAKDALGFALDVFLQNALAAVADVYDRAREITVVVESLKVSHYRVTVSDNGNGFPEEYRDRVFKEALPSRSGGTGFGLLYSGDVITENGGTVGLDTNSPSGASFHVEFRSQEDLNE